MCVCVCVCVIRSGLKETFIKRYIVKRTNKTEIRSEEQTEQAESCRRGGVRVCVLCVLVCVLFFVYLF